MAPLVSVLIPAFNAEATIAETLRSVQAQTYNDLEIIVVDDGSKDETARIVAQFERDSRVRLIRQSNAGVAAARNVALAASRGTLLAPLDADDLWHAQKIELQIENLARAGDDAGLDYTWSVDIDEQSRIISCNPSHLEGDLYEDLILANFIGNSSVPLIRRSVLESVGGWDPSLRAAQAQGCEDWLLYLKVAERSKVTVTPAFLVGYRQLPHAMSRNVVQMNRSYNMVMSQARLDHPTILESKFRKSGVDFDLYVSDMCWSSSRPLSGLWFTLHAMAREPLNWRTHARVVSSITGRLFNRHPKGVGADRATFHGLPFSSLTPDARCNVCSSG